MPRPAFVWWLRGAPLAAALAAASADARLAAQDVVVRGLEHGLQPPASLVQRLERDPTAFEFRRVWRQKAQRVRAARVLLERSQGPRLSIAQLRGASAALTGTLRVPVILGAYAGSAPVYTPAQYQDRLFGNPSSGYSAKRYYQEISRGAFALDGTATPWLPLPQPASYYDPSAFTDPMFGRTPEFLRDAVTAADAGVDFGQFDNDGPDGVPNSGDDDGYVDVAAFLYPAAGKSCGGPGIWPHRWTYGAWWGAPFSTADPAAGGGTIKVDDYLVMGGIACDRSSLMAIGTFAHEMGHGLGLPDLYDTDTGDGYSAGLGEWDLMASGNYRGESYPAHMGAWSKDFLGWVNVEIVTASRTAYTLAPVYQGGTVLRYDVPNAREYFLLEHREPTGSDLYLHGPGLLAYHVDQAVVDSTLELNRVNAHARQGVDLVEADGLAQLNGGVNRGDAGDPFPGSAARTSLGFATAPSSNANGGFASGLELRAISLQSGTLAFDLATAAALQAPASVSLTARSGSSASLALRVNAAGGAPLAVQAVPGASWLTVSPAGGSTPADLVLTANAAGLPAGTHSTTVTLTASGAVNAPLPVQVSLAVTTAVLTLGDSLRDTISKEGEADTVRILLNAGDVLDIGGFSEAANTLFSPRVTLLDPSGFTVASTNYFRPVPRAGILVKARANSTGTYRVVVRDSRTQPNYGGTPMAYVLRTRPSGPFLDLLNPQVWNYLKQGSGPVTDTVWVINRGTGTGAFTVTADSGFVAISPVSGAAAGSAAAPAQAAAAAAPPAATEVAGRARPGRVATANVSLPAGATVPVVVTFTPGSRPQGQYRSVLAFHLPPDVWNGEYPDTTYLRLHDPAAVVLDSTHMAYPGFTALAPDGALVMASDRDLLRVDTATGVAAVWVPAVSNQLAELRFGPDSLLYAADYAGKRVIRIERDGSVTTLFTGAAAVAGLAVLPDRTVFAAVGGSLVRLPPGGTPETVLTTTRPVFAWSLAYKEGWIYYGAGGALRRFNVSTRADEERAALPENSNSQLLAISAGRSGKLYGTQNHTLGAILVMNDDGTVTDRIWAPAVGWGLSIADGRLYGTGYFPGNSIWRVALAGEAPVPFTGYLVGDPSGDGRVTSMDALGVLSYVVGKPLPPGWNMGVAGDANCDGRVTALDALVILSQVVQKDVSGFCVGGRR